MKTWIYRIKSTPNGSVNKYKARLVIKGCSQKAGIDYNETFSPVARFESIRILLSLAAVKDYEIVQFDIKTAFLYGDLNEEIFMTQPEGFENGSGQVCKLKKSLYGFKQAPRQWHEKFDSSLKQLGLKSTDYDSCVYTMENDSLYLVLYVDDGLIIGKSKTAINCLLTKLQNKFEITTTLDNYYLGLEIERDREKKIIRVHQSMYTKSILKRFKMDSANAISVPADVHTILKRNIDNNGQLGPVVDVPYRQVIGSLMYLAIGTRPDITFAVNNLSQFLERPSNEHWNAAKRVLKYLRSTIDIGIKFSSSNYPNVLTAYSDADYGSCVDSRKSISGVILMLNNGPVIWSSRKQSIVATSTTEAEYIAAHDASKEVVWARGFLKQLNVEQVRPTILYCDNAAAEKLIKNPVYHKRTTFVKWQTMIK